MHNREPSSNPSFPLFQERLWPAGKKEKAREQREIEEEEESGKVVTAESPSPPPSDPVAIQPAATIHVFLPFQHYELSGILRPKPTLFPLLLPRRSRKTVVYCPTIEPGSEATHS